MSFIFGSEKECEESIGNDKENKSEDGDDKLLEDVDDLILKDDSSVDS